MAAAARAPQGRTRNDPVLRAGLPLRHRTPPLGDHLGHDVAVRHRAGHYLWAVKLPGEEERPAEAAE